MSGYTCSVPKYCFLMVSVLLETIWSDSVRLGTIVLLTLETQEYSIFYTGGTLCKHIVYYSV